MQFPLLLCLLPEPGVSEAALCVHATVPYYIRAFSVWAVLCVHAAQWVCAAAPVIPSRSMAKWRGPVCIGYGALLLLLELAPGGVPGNAIQ